jgi:hypothetical protein
VSAEYSALSPDQQQQILSAVIGEAGLSRIYMSILVNRADAPPSRRDNRAIDEAGLVVINWVIRHHVAVAIYELVLEERVLIDVNEQGEVYFVVTDIGDDITASEAARLLDELTVERIIEHFGDERADVQPIPHQAFDDLQAMISQRYMALGQIENLAPKARRNTDA